MDNKSTGRTTLFREILSNQFVDVKLIVFMVDFQL